MQFITLKNTQLFLLALLVGLISAGLVLSFQIYQSQQLLPLVVVDKAGACTKVLNFENGHTFGCQDVDVVLRRYRTQHDVQALPR